MALIIAGMLMGRESSSARAEYMARELLLFDKLIVTTDIVARIEAVTAVDFRTLAAGLMQTLQIPRNPRPDSR